MIGLFSFNTSNTEPRPTFGSNINNPELDLQSNTIQEYKDDSINEIFKGATYTIVQDQVHNLCHRDIHGLHMTGARMVLKLSPGWLEGFQSKEKKRKL